VRGLMWLSRAAFSLRSVASYCPELLLAGKLPIVKSWP